MKYILIIITLLFSNALEKQESSIYGTWKLIQIDVNQEILRPEQNDYFLTISEELISYNLEFNKCWSENFSLTNNQINCLSTTRTELCCDGRYDTISNYINYQGVYELEQNQLIITTANSKLFLERVLE